MVDGAVGTRKNRAGWSGGALEGGGGEAGKDFDLIISFEIH